jgi:DTW domain-containing protein YfiP
VSRSFHHSRKEVCPVCRLRPDLCYCRGLRPVAASTPVTIFCHVSELRRTSNTARLLFMTLAGCRITVVGRLGDTPDPTSAWEGDREPLLLFPEPGAPVLSRELAALLPRPLSLVVPDGTWSQARRMTRRHPALLPLHRVQLPPVGTSGYALRRRGPEGGICTAEAVARALGILEGPETEAALLGALDGMIRRVLWGRRTQEPYPAAGG